MTTFGQFTIHSKLAKYNISYFIFQKTNDQANSGRVVKGVNSQHGINRIISKSYWNNQQNQSQIMRQIEILPKNKLNVNRKMKNKKVIPGNNKNNEIVLMESSIFPAIYFKKTLLRNVLKQFSFPQNCQQLSPEDGRNTLIYQIISNLFNQINFYIFNIMAGQNLDNNSYYVFFSDCQTLPFTKCCNSPVFLQLQQNGSGKILCNSQTCKHANLAQFLINFDDGKKLWPNIPYFAQASSKDKHLKSKISKLIINGKYKRQSLVQMVQDTSKQIVSLFYQSKKMTNIPSQHQMSRMVDNIHDDNTFMTGAGIAQNQQHSAHHSYNNIEVDQLKQQIVQDPQTNNTQALLLQEQDNNLQTLKMKLKYITKKQTDFAKKLSKSIVEESKIFQHNFDIIRKIDEQMLKNRNARTTAKITFPQLMNQINRSQKNKKTSLNKTYQS